MSQGQVWKHTGSQIRRCERRSITKTPHSFQYAMMRSDFRYDVEQIAAWNARPESIRTRPELHLLLPVLPAPEGSSPTCHPEPALKCVRRVALTSTLRVAQRDAANVQRIPPLIQEHQMLRDASVSRVMCKVLQGKTVSTPRQVNLVNLGSRPSLRLPSSALTNSRPITSCVSDRK